MILITAEDVALMSRKIALITGITGQDGTFLTEFLYSKGYEVHGLIRRSSISKASAFSKYRSKEKRFFLHFGDLSDSAVINKLIKTIKPDEIYNLAAQSSVQNSFASAEYTTEINALGVLRLLEAIRLSGLISKTKF